MFDIIGDIHGHFSLLKNLLKSMGYERKAGSFFHPERKAVFVGDFLNRGDEIRQTLRSIRRMTESGDAYAILGNHEVNAILYHLKTPEKIPLLPKESKRAVWVSTTIQEFRSYPEEWKDHLRWLRTLPFYLDFGDIRIVHACWKDENIAMLKENLPEGKIPKTIFRDLVLKPKTPLSQAILQTTRGIHYILPHDLSILDSLRRTRHIFRMKWWEDPAGKTFQDISFESKFRLPEYTIPAEIAPSGIPYPEDAPPVFFGHYCVGNGPSLVKNNLCCVDGCVWMNKTLTAYRWDGEKNLVPANLVSAVI